MMSGGGASFEGYYVSLTCHNESIFEGEVLSIDESKQLITLSHAHELLPNGKAAKFPQITITGSHVKNLKIIRERINVMALMKDHNVSKNDKASPRDEKKAHRSNSREKLANIPPPQINNNKAPNFDSFPSSFSNDAKMTPTKNNRKSNTSSSSPDNNNPDSPTNRLSPYNNNNNSSNNNSNNNKSSSKNNTRNSCFSNDDVDCYPDFDFEENLARFDKQAVFEKLGLNKDVLLGSSSGNSGNSRYDKKMAPTDNVLEHEPVSLRQIKVPLEHAGKEYTTKDGFVVPAITLALKQKLFRAAQDAGLSIQQIAENAGVCVCQMALQLVGGSLRINPKNDHQRPEFVVLAGAHMQGLQAICAARHLVNHTAKVILYLPSSSSMSRMTPGAQTQLDLFLKSGGKLITSYKELPSQPVDMIIDAMYGMDTSQHNADWLPYAVSWANQNKAPMFSIDPCMPETKSELPDIKWCIAMSLPLIKAPNVGTLYLADLGIPRGVFKDVGIQYMSPFTDKFYIPLYNC